MMDVEVVDYPYKHIYHGESCEYPIPWYGDDDKIGTSGPVRFFRSWSGRKYSEDEIVSMMPTFDLVVLESPRPLAVEALEKLNDRRSLPPIAFLESEDYDYIHKEYAERFDVVAYFKRELSFIRKEVHPFPFSSYIIDDDRYDFSDDTKQIDVFFMVGNTHISRVYITRFLKKLVKKYKWKAIVALDHGVKPFVDPEIFLDGSFLAFQKNAKRYALDEYLRCIAKSKIAVSVRGFGRDTIRFWENMSYHTLNFSDNLYDMGLIHPEPFTHHENIVFYKSDCSDLEESLLYYLQDDNEREKVAAAGRTHLIEHHTNIARAKQFLDVVEEWT